MDLSKRRIAIAALVLLHLLVSLCNSVAFGIDRTDNEWGIGWFLGTVFAQASLLAVWVSLGGWPFSRRLPVVLLLLAASTLFFVIPIGREGEWVGAMFYCSTLFVQWLVIQAPLWAIRLVYGWKISAPDALDGVSSREEVQFGIRQLLAWTTGIAVLLAIGRWLISDEAIESHTPDIWEMVCLFVLLTGLNVLLALPVIWAALVRRWMLVWIAVAILFAVILTAAEPVLFERIQGGSGDAGIFWRLNGVHFLWVFCSLGVIRLCGYRFERTKARGWAQERVCS